MISFDEAFRLVCIEAADFGSEKILLEEASGRVLSKDIFADRDYPPFNRATMDGYALRTSDWESGLRTFFIQATIWPGKNESSTLNAGCCFKIMTGAPVPNDIDAIIRKEDSTGAIDIHPDSGLESIQFDNIQVRKNQNIAQKGQEYENGEMVPFLHNRIDPIKMSILAALGHFEITVKKLPTVALFTSGNEVKTKDEPVSEFEIRNSNHYLLSGLLKQWNIQPQICRHLKDSRELIGQAISEAKNTDILIFNGGVSAGDADFIPELLEQAGMKIIFHKVAMKPGKPILFGKFSNGTLVFALPGNPLSCLVTFNLFVQTLLRASLGMQPCKNQMIKLSDGRSKAHPLTEFFPVTLDSSSGMAERISFNGSGDFGACLFATGFAQHDAATLSLSPKDLVKYFPL